MYIKCKTYMIYVILYIYIWCIYIYVIYIWYTYYIYIYLWYIYNIIYIYCTDGERINHSKNLYSWASHMLLHILYQFTISVSGAGPTQFSWFKKKVRYGIFPLTISGWWYTYTPLKIMKVSWDYSSQYMEY